MIRLAILILLGLTVLVIIGMLLRRSSKPLADFTPKHLIISKPEQILYQQLLQAFPSHFVLAQVSLNQVIQVPSDLTSQSNRAKLFNQINGKTIDFVVLNQDYTLALAIELDDKSHQHPKRKRADKTKEEALKSAGIKLIRYDVGRIPLAAELKALLP